MPIRAEQRALYPVDWPQLSASIRFGRANGRCEGCGRPHGKLVLCVGDGRWFDRQDGSWRDERGRRTARPDKPYRLRWTIIRLAACHLDHDPTNSELENLAAWCQRCHLLHDRPEHRRRAAITVLLRRALGDLFLGPIGSDALIQIAAPHPFIDVLSPLREQSTTRCRGVLRILFC